MLEDILEYRVIATRQSLQQLLQLQQLHMAILHRTRSVTFFIYKKVGFSIILKQWWALKRFCSTDGENFYRNK
jgi:hypothetical protein